MKKSTIVTIILIAAAVVLGVIFISWYLRKATPLYIQGTVECTTYKASSKVPGRIEEMKVEEGQHVTKGELLYTLSTPELNAKLQQAEAVKSAASAMDQKALTGARIQQKEAALNLWEKAQAGLLLAQKTFDRVNNLYEQGVVPAQKLDEARANLQWRFCPNGKQSLPAHYTWLLQFRTFPAIKQTMPKTFSFSVSSGI